MYVLETYLHTWQSHPITCIHSGDKKLLFVTDTLAAIAPPTDSSMHRGRYATRPLQSDGC